MKRPIAIMLSILLGMVLVAALGLGGYLYFNRAHHAKKQTKTALTPAQALALQVTLPQMLANLGDGGIVQFTMSLQATDSQTKTEITDLQNQIDDFLIRMLKQYSSTQVDSVGGFSQLKRAIIAGVNQMLPLGRVTAVYFANEIVQSGG